MHQQNKNPSLQGCLSGPVFNQGLCLQRHAPSTARSRDLQITLPILRDHLLSMLLNGIISHTLQAPFSPKALHCAIEHTLSNSRKTLPRKTSTGLF